MKTKNALKTGSAVCTGIGVAITTVGLVVHPILPLGIVIIIKANSITAGALSLAATIVENRDDISNKVNKVTETVCQEVGKAKISASKNLHDAGETISSFFGNLNTAQENAEDIDVASNGEVTNDVTGDFA